MPVVRKNLSNWSLLLHVAGLAHHLALLCGFTRIDLDGHQHPVIEELKPFCLFTISGWCVELQLLHIVLSLTARWHHWRGNSRQGARFDRIKDTVFRGLVLPCTFMISALFWALYLWDRSLVYPSLWDAVVPSWMNYCTHVTPAVLSALELMVPRGKQSLKAEAALYWGISVGYSVIVNIIYVWYGVWLYPFLGALSWPQRLAAEGAFALAGRGLLGAVGGRDSRNKVC